MSNVITVVPKLPHMIARESVIDTLEALLKRAYSGEIQAVAYVTVSDGKTADWGWSECPHDLAMMGGIAVLAGKFERECM